MSSRAFNTQAELGRKFNLVNLKYAFQARTSSLRGNENAVVYIKKDGGGDTWKKIRPMSVHTVLLNKNIDLGVAFESYEGGI